MALLTFYGFKLSAIPVVVLLVAIGMWGTFCIFRKRKSSKRRRSPKGHSTFLRRQALVSYESENHIYSYSNEGSVTSVKPYVPPGEVANPSPQQDWPPPPPPPMQDI